MKRLQQAPCLVFVASFRNGEPVRVRPESRETLPHHADMLRYDLGFHSPDDTSLVIFPWFKHKTDGAYPPAVTVRRWDSFGLRVTEMPEENAEAYLRAHPIGDWVNYRHPGTTYHLLEPVTLNDWLKENPKVTIHGWRGRYETAEAQGRYWAVTG